MQIRKMAISMGTERDLIILLIVGCTKMVNRIYMVKQIKGTIARAGEVGIVGED